MLPEERDRVMARVLACWPRPPMADSQILVWNDHLTKMQYEAAAAAIEWCERNCKHRPALSEFHEAYAAQRPGAPAGALRAPECGICEDGWVQVRCSVCPGGSCGFEVANICQIGHGTSQKCPNGCRPKTLEERAAIERAEDDRWRRDRARRQTVPDLRFDSVRDPSGAARAEVDEVF